MNPGRWGMLLCLLARSANVDHLSRQSPGRAVILCGHYPGNSAIR